ncbi:Initiation factor eIF-4 gamma, MA3 [Cinara cedri]|uniref:Initiation factor eIF-4 gamma, MA3 n=1 Tax=Cinara cedri TaxID=506608 RepID=A0A5E4NME0_9HEMI|nr:Initiation factor eIF-4 gamma, MA3 [Cinara cedri]
MNRLEILNSLSSSLWNINLEDINKIIQSISALPIKSASSLDEVTNKIHCKIYNLDHIVSQLLSFTNDETSIDNELSPIIKSLVHEIKSLFDFGWINKSNCSSYLTDSFELVNHKTNVENNDHILPFQSQNYFVSKSMEMLAESVYEECYEILFMFIHTENFEEIVHLLTVINTWLHYDGVSFAVAMILVAIIYEQKTSARKLLDNLVNEGWLSKDSIQLGINRVLDDIDEIAIKSLMDISNEFSFE